jgi:DNA-binding CsgD family transcriptional regulator
VRRDNGGSAWPVVGREDAVRRALAALGDDAKFHGVVLWGEAGVGKSTLARALAEAVESRGLVVRFMLGTESGREVPLGALYHLVTLDAVHEHAVMLAAAQRTLEQQKNLVLVVDDAHLLDPLSATLVYHLAAGGATRLIVTVRSTTAVPDTMTALWKERLLLRLPVDVLSRQQTDELVCTVLGDAVEARLIDELHRLTAGNPLMLRGLLNAGRESGVLVRSTHGWHLSGALHPDRELYDLLEVRLQSLTAEELEAVEVLAIAEALNWENLRGLCDSDAVARLERRGIIHVFVDQSHTTARLANPVVGEVALQRAGVVRSRQLSGVLAQHLRKEFRASEQRSEKLDVRSGIKLAQLMMRSDLAPDVGMIIEAAASALALSNLALAEELARFAFDHGGGLPAALVLFEAISWQGRGAEARSLHVDVRPGCADERLITQWGCRRASNLFFVRGQVEKACLVLAEAKHRAESHDSTRLATAMEAVFACFSAEIPKAIALGLPLCASEQPSTRAWAVTSTAWALALAGRHGDVHRIASAGGDDLLGQMGPYRFVIGMAEVVAATAAGDFPAAERVWQRYGRTITVSPQADAYVHAMLGLLQSARGALASACAAFDASVSASSQGFPSPWLMLVAAQLAQAEGARGNGEAAAAALGIAEEAYGPQVAVFLPELELARAWERAAVGQTAAARRHAVRAAQVARDGEMAAVEVRALQVAVRFGDRSQAARLGELAAALGTPLAEAGATQARGLGDHDGDLLEAAAGRFAELGALALAADALAQAATEHARSGARGRAVECSIRAYGLVGRCGLRTPATGTAARPLPLSGREHDIAMLVRAGLSNRQIADRLVVSVRTVEGHLYRIFTKLGINQRDQLIRLLTLEPDGA